LFQFLLPSLLNTLDCGFRYLVMIGYDLGDQFYDRPEGLAAVREWFQSRIQLPLEQHGIAVEIAFTALNNTLKKPGPIFNAMALNVFHNYKADYYYRLNDDSEFVDRWPRTFVDQIHKMGPSFGVIGPMCHQGLTTIMTHDFVHRTHMEIFYPHYYPPELVDWYMDRW
jgi:hypothetical protein